MTEAFLGFGSNLGCKVGTIRRAVFALERMSCIHGLELSPFYKTEPVGMVDQDWFVNAVARFETDLSPRELLAVCLKIESELGRERGERWGPRTIDIDLLFYGEDRVLEEGLSVPHPRVAERAFVLRPLLDLAPKFGFGGVSYSSLLADVEEQGVERMAPLVAILGASEKPERYANMAQALLLEKGYRVAPVSAREGVILGVPALGSLTDCNEPVDTLTLYVGSARLPGFLPQILEVCPRRVIFNPGTENLEVRERLEQVGIETVEACTLVMLKLGSFDE